MADITMCGGVNDYPVCTHCYRRNARPDPTWQSYFVTPPVVRRTLGIQNGDIDGNIHFVYNCEYQWMIPKH
jgi:hypothetical protein